MATPTQPTSHKLIVPYICLECGSFQGEPAPNNQESWHWRVVKRDDQTLGRIGPFCSEAHVRRFSLEALQTETAKFTLGDWQRLDFLRHEIAVGHRTEGTE